MKEFDFDEGQRSKTIPNPQSIIKMRQKASIGTSEASYAHFLLITPFKAQINIFGVKIETFEIVLIWD